MKRFIGSLIVVFICFGLVVAGGQAEAEYPKKPVTVICTFPAGGLADIIARVTAQAFEDELGVPFQVINKPGGAMIPGSMFVLGKPADGYTMIMVATPTILTLPYINNSPYSHKDFEVLFFVGQQKNVLYVPVDSEIKTLQDFVEAGKTKKLIIGTNAIGAPPTLSMAQFVRSAGLEVEYLTAGTLPKAIVASIGGHSDAALGQLRQLAQYPDEIRALAILDENRHEILPDVPTVKEALPDMDVKATSWVRSGFAVKKGTPQEIIDVLVQTAEKAINTEEFAKKFNESGNVSHYTGYEDAQKVLQEGIDFYHPMIDALGLKKK
jgi:tripartite-type tricarboxylate transporter receptor subunit TctC